MVLEHADLVTGQPGGKPAQRGAIDMIGPKSQRRLKGLDGSQDVAIEVTPALRVLALALVRAVHAAIIAECRLLTKHDNHGYTAFVSLCHLDGAKPQRHDG